MQIEQIANTGKQMCVTEWCAEADDWNECNEENGNMVENHRRNTEKANNSVENLVQSRLEPMNVNDENKNDTKDCQGKKL